MKTGYLLPTVRLRTRGAGAEELAEYATEKVRVALRQAPGRVLSARLFLARDAAPRTATARLDVDVNGSVVHVRAEAETLTEAVDLMQDRLRSQLARVRH